MHATINKEVCLFSVVFVICLFVCLFVCLFDRASLQQRVEKKMHHRSTTTDYEEERLLTKLILLLKVRLVHSFSVSLTFQVCFLGTWFLSCCLLQSGNERASCLASQGGLLLLALFLHFLLSSPLSCEQA